MPTHSHVAEPVKAAVRAWARERDGHAGARALAEHRARLSAELRPELVRELAEVAAEVLLALLTRTDGLDVPAKPVDVGGEALHPRQAERFGAWLEDQPLIARALGLDGAAWQKQLERAMTTLGASGDRAPVEVASRALAGTPVGRFENRPGAGQSASAGLRGLLALRRF